MITSANNTQVKNIIQLNQEGQGPQGNRGLFVAEGRKMFGKLQRIGFPGFM